MIVLAVPGDAACGEPREEANRMVPGTTIPDSLQSGNAGPKKDRGNPPNAGASPSRE